MSVLPFPAGVVHSSGDLATPTAGAYRAEADRAARVAAQLDRVRAYSYRGDGRVVAHLWESAPWRP